MPGGLCIHPAVIPLDGTEETGGREKTTLVFCGDFFMEGPPAGIPPEDYLRKRFSQDIRDVIRSSDSAIVNLEGAATVAGMPVPKSGPHLRMHPAILDLVKALGFSVISLANNHIMDYGPQGLADTLGRAQELHLAACGAGMDRAAAMQPHLITGAGGTRIAVFSFCEREFGIAGEKAPGSAWVSHPQAPAAVAQWRGDADAVIVIAHGGLEYLPLPPPGRQQVLRRFIDCGADMVIGHHPHVPQGWEVYRGKHIFYSLGNCMFDYPEGKMHPKSDWGYCVQAEVAGTSMGALRLVLTEQQEGRLALMGGTRDPEACYEYLRRSGAIVQDPDLFPAYWQELALRRFSEEYVPQIRKYSTLHPLRDTLAAVLRRRQTDARKKRKALDFLNLVRNESHSEAVHTALGLQTGADADLRTPRIRNDVDELLAWTR